MCYKKGKCAGYYGMIKVIAIGNRMMQDDGAAVAVAEYLKNRLEAIGLEVIIAETDIQFFFHMLNEDDFIILLDAAFTGASPGSIHRYVLQEAADIYGEAGFPHDMTIFDLIKIYSKELKGYLITIEIAEAGFGCELSETLKGLFSSICCKVEETVCDILKEEQNA